MKTAKRVAIYARTSVGEQTIDNQIRDLTKAAKHRGWKIVATFKDEGVSGAKGRDQRPGFDALYKAATRAQIDVVAAWSVDRLGRSLQDLCGFLAELHGLGINLYLHQQGIDTTTPGGKAMFQMMGVFAEFERSMIRERVKAGIDRAKANGTKTGKPIGRPRLPAEVEKRIRAELATGKGIGRIRRELGVGTAAVQRVRNEMLAKG